jgi:4-coumarate--CoA ligase
MPSVKDCVVIPVLDEEAGELPRAYVVKVDGATVTEQDIIQYIEKHVAPHKRLRGGVVFTDIIPKSASGKLLRRVQIQIDREKSKK